MIFWRIVDNQVHPVHETDNLGFEKSEGLRIPDEYLDKQEFMVMRTAHGIGDWGIISAMPRLLKEKYPDCKVYVPTKKLLKKLFGDSLNAWSSWDNPYENVNNIFDTNPYVDDFVDEMGGEIYHDHYRIYDKDNTDIPLLKQMLKFWQFTDNEMEDSQPELYWSDDEKKLGDEIIKEYVGYSTRTVPRGYEIPNEYGCLLISDRYDYSQDKLIIDKLNEHKLKYFYFSERPIEQTEFDYVDKGLDLRHIHPRIQLYIRSKAKVNIGNQCGMLDCIPRYSKVYTVQRQFPISHNFIVGENYLDSEKKRKLLGGVPDKFESKTTTSRKFKSDLIDFLGNDFKDKNIIEIGCSLGYTTSILSGYFNKVTAVDFDPSRTKSAGEFNEHRNNINFVTKDVYGTRWDFDKNHDVVFIDCVHEYDYIKSDITNSINYFDKPLLIFDDYGLFPNTVMKCVDEFVESGVLKVVKKIGHKKGVVFPKTAYKIMTDYEGIICQVL